MSRAGTEEERGGGGGVALNLRKDDGVVADLEDPVVASYRDLVDLRTDVATLRLEWVKRRCDLFAHLGLGPDFAKRYYTCEVEDV